MQIFANHKLVAPQKRRFFSQARRAALFAAAIALAFLLAAALIFPAAWRDTARREAYLPQLEAQSRQYSDDGPLLALLGARQVEAGEFASAAETLKRAAGAGAQDESIWMTLASATAASGQPSRAIADLQIGIKSLPESPLLRARLSEAIQDRPTASPAALAHTINPEGAKPLLAVYARGSFLNDPVSWWGRQHSASSGFATREAWVAEQPDNAQAQRLWGTALVQNRRLPEAETALRLAVILDPHSPSSHLALAYILRQRGHLQEGALQYIAALKLHPNWLPALLGLGAAFEASGIPGYALDFYAQATDVAPNSADAWIALANAEHQNEGLNAKALVSYQNAVRLAPERTDFLDDYASALHLASRWDEAEVLLNRRLSAAPEDAYAHFLLGGVLMESKPTPKRLKEGEGHLREALRLSPRNPVVEVQFAELLLDRGQGSEAVQLLSDALLRLPFERRAILLLGHAYRMIGQDALAERVGQQAAVLQRDEDQASVLEGAKRDHTTDIPFHQKLADVYDRIGKPDKAAQERQTIQRLQAGSQQALQTSRELEDAVSSVLAQH
jgi:tetratricopeptide (TPR) repeat protein